MANPVNLTIKLNPTRRRMVKSLRRLFVIIANSDAKLYNSPKPRAFLPIFPTDDPALQAALVTVNDRIFQLIPLIQ